MIHKAVRGGGTHCDAIRESLKVSLWLKLEKWEDVLLYF
jgi:hypothetical protein